ncbi:hypothetical protein E5D57_002786 [Metarhizium anisopliae]|nr:hypothetical protein E5D57_002786 [Metarhizium anisopliae]
MIARRLSAYANLAPLFPRHGNDTAEHPLDGLVLLVKQIRQLARVAVHPQRQLRQVVGANREAVKVVGKLGRENHVGRNLAHDVDEQPLFAADQAVFRHDLQDHPGLADRPAKGDHDDGVGEAHVLPEPPDGAALEPEALPVARRVVPRGAAEAEHGVLLVGLELGAADEPGVLVGLEVAHADNGRPGVHGRAERRQALRQLVDKVARLLGVSRREGGDLPPRLLVLEPVKVDERHGVDLDGVADDKLHAREADAVAWEAPPAICRGGIGQVEHDLGPGRRQAGHVQGLGGDVGRAVVHEARCALGAGNRHVLAAVQHVRGVSRADHGREAQLAADNGGVRGASAVVRDDGRRALHHGHPVRVCRAGDQDGVVHELVQVPGAFDEAEPSRDGCVADREARGEDAPLAAHLVYLEDGGVAAGVHRFRPGLDNKQLARHAVLGPLHVHGHAVVLLNRVRPAGELQDLLVAEDEGGLLGLGGADVARRSALVLVAVHHLDGLVAALLVDDRHQAPVDQERLEYLVLVRVDGALDDVLAQPPRRVDEHHLVEAAFRVDGKHDAGAAHVGAHHLLHADRERDAHVVEPPGLAVADGAVGEERGVAPPAGVQEGIAPRDVEIRLLLAGKARLGQVFCRGAGAHRDAQVLPVGLAAELVIRGLDGGGRAAGPGAAEEEAANLVAGLAEGQLAVLPFGYQCGGVLLDVVSAHVLPVHAGRCCESGRHLDSPVRQGGNHLANRGILAADQRTILPSYLVESEDERLLGVLIVRLLAHFVSMLHLEYTGKVFGIGASKRAGATALHSRSMFYESWTVAE